MSKSKAIPVSEDTWQMESDIRTLARAKAILKDKPYHEKLQAHASKMKADMQRQKDEAQEVLKMADKGAKKK